MTSPKNMNARERARLAAEQAAARKRDQRILIAVIAGFVVVVVAAGIGFQAWRTNRSPSAAPSTSVSASPVTISNGRPIVLGSPQAPTTITLYEDFHCPHCAEFEEQFGPVITASSREWGRAGGALSDVLHRRGFRGGRKRHGVRGRSRFRADLLPRVVRQPHAAME